MLAAQGDKSAPPLQTSEFDAAIVDLVSRDAIEIPPYPAVALKVQALVRRQDYGLDELTRLVASDQALAADALRCANSAFYSRGAPAQTLNAAINRIGASEVVRLAVASGLGAHARKGGPLAALKRRVWLDALACAALAQELARKRGLSAEEAFLCGLLHDFGKVIAIVCIEQILQSRRDTSLRPVEEWMGLVERFHVELGLVLATRWKLPALVSDVISLHHGESSAAELPAMVDVVAVTDEVVALLADESWLSPEALGAISGLAAAECELVARVLDRLPGFIASFEGAAPLVGSAGSAVAEKRPEDFLSGPTPVSFPVQVVLHREIRQYRATKIATGHLTVNGPSPLPESVLMELTLKTAAPFSCWATAKLYWPELGGYTVLLQPFALNGEAALAWRKLLQSSAAS
ncbi:MAG TPA: HDOD domain-containing protein [Anaeromyxobacteraceae bacterium]|nr:HDOD domain-containing protein [Anaeromyxobacteraceae bacterium]